MMQENPTDRFQNPYTFLHQDTFWQGLESSFISPLQASREEPEECRIPKTLLFQRERFKHHNNTSVCFCPTTSYQHNTTIKNEWDTRRDFFAFLLLSKK